MFCVEYGHKSDIGLSICATALKLLYNLYSDAYQSFRSILTVELQRLVHLWDIDICL